MTPPLKVCRGRCGRALPVDADHFHRHARSPDGFRARCRECIAADGRDAALVRRLGLRSADVTALAAAYRRGAQDGAAALLRRLRAEGRLLPSDDEAAAQTRAERILAKVDEVLAERR